MLLSYEAGQGDQRIQGTALLTRRVLTTWLADLTKIADISAAVPPETDPKIRSVVTQAHHTIQAARAQAGRSEPVAVASLAVPPPLVKKIINGQRKHDGMWVSRITLVNQDAPITLVLAGRTLHGLLALIRKQQRLAHWGLEVSGVR